jgi:hypothetical protein
MDGRKGRQKFGRKHEKTGAAGLTNKEKQKKKVSSIHAFQTIVFCPNICLDCFACLMHFAHSSYNYISNYIAYFRFHPWSSEAMQGVARQR